MSLPIALLLALISVGANAAERHDSVPTKFLGEWSADLGACGTDTDDSVLVIRPHHITFWGSNGPIKAVVTRGALEIMLIVESTGEGETWLDAQHFRLSADGTRLATLHDGTESFMRYRCPAAKRSVNK
ncbi:hypothetical protein [Stenotrophomonas sp. 24(2023)]|uniref:hypothetical protein n=1 Tax=Stenotrophomonas sp. 24(2023) TaxID=3068324 RepID=UPI0027E1E4BC|nr:hypothetical protein [Stenotrophomonas sp. 24(2023)]WMJ70629.1 hypothetical protein Q9R17_05885 [Stenotrophomonas sp. 24(2023)]